MGIWATVKAQGDTDIHCMCRQDVWTKMADDKWQSWHYKRTVKGPHKLWDGVGDQMGHDHDNS